MEAYMKWAAWRGDCWNLPEVLDKLQANSCKVMEVWKYGHEAIVLYQDTGSYPKGMDPVTNGTKA